MPPETVASLTLRVQAVEGAQQSHEDICAVRYKALEDAIGAQHSTTAELRSDVKGIFKAAWGIALAILAFTAVQLWNGRAPQAPAPVAQQ